jgi:serine/threonine protein kinase
MNPSITISSTKSTSHYGDLLHDHGLSSNLVGQYLEVGAIIGIRGWILHISVSKYELSELIELLLPVLIKERVPFRIAVNEDIADLLVNGHLGYAHTGKVIKVYPQNDDSALHLAEKLIALTQCFKGPAIPTDRYLGGQVYTRYGGYNPVTVVDGNGMSETVIFDPDYGYIKEEYSIPFVLPANVSWPFSKLASPTQAPSTRVLHGLYYPVRILKSDVKGMVSKALRFRRPFFLNWCLVKEGKRHASLDEYGRDIAHRLTWQKELLGVLSAGISVPKVFDFFEEEGNTYLVMEFIKGNSLEDLIAATYINIGWLDLDVSEQYRILSWLLELTGVIEKIHLAGYVHRDITPANFILGKNQVLYPIDLELAYDLNQRPPMPPFGLGTIGYMSPEQLTGITPTVKEDVYGLGALMINFFTNHMRKKLEIDHPGLLRQQLLFHIGHPAMVSLIVECISKEPDGRPEIKEIRKTIEECMQCIKVGTPIVPPMTSRHFPSSDQVGEVIERALLALAEPIMTNSYKLWFSKSGKKEKSIDNEQLTSNIRVGLGYGIGGVLLLLAKAKRAGFSTREITSHYDVNLQFVDDNFLCHLPNVPNGFYEGSAGITLSLAEGIRSGDIVNDTSRLQKILQCLEIRSKSSGHATGAAEAGLAVLSCSGLFEEYVIAGLLRPYIEVLCSGQHKNGSWTIQPSQAPSPVSIPTWKHGVAGITGMLALCAKRLHEPAIEVTVRKGLDWLKKQAQRQGTAYTWRDPISRNPVHPWLTEGVLGIALAFLMGYDMYPDPAYKRIGEGILRHFPKHLVVQQLSLEEGLAGIGEVYLEAYRILGSQEWLDRAGWIANVLLHSHRLAGEKGIYWLTDGANRPTAGLASGCSGVIHFLLRYQQPDRLGFPLLP